MWTRMHSYNSIIFSILDYYIQLKYVFYIWINGILMFDIGYSQFVEYITLWRDGYLKFFEC